MMYITIAIYRQASMNIRINVGQQQNWLVEGGCIRQKNVLHFSLNHGILSRMALFLEKLEYSNFFFNPSLSLFFFSAFVC